MQPALDSSTLDRLIALGRKQGHLTNRDLESNLPIASMGAEEIALIVVHLEESGVPVELEDSLVHRPIEPGPAPVRSAEIIPFPDRSAAACLKRQAAPLQTTAPARPEARKPASHAKRPAHWAVAFSGLLVLGLLVGMVTLLGV
jgi:Sigma-70 factor, region 1.1